MSARAKFALGDNRPPPLLEEVSKFFKYLSKGEGSYDDGLNFYLHGDGKNNVIWKLLESQFDDAPDRGMVGPPAVLRVDAAASPPGPSKRAHSEFADSPGGFAAKRRATSKPAARPIWRFMSRTKGEGAGRGAGKDRVKPPGGGDKGTHSNHVPTFMRDKARLEISRKFPQGSWEFRR